LPLTTLKRKLNPQWFSFEFGWNHVKNVPVACLAMGIFFTKNIGGTFMSQINLTFPDGTVKQFDSGISVQEIANSISISLGKKAGAGKFNDQAVDLRQALVADGAIEIITKDSEEGLNVLWQTAAFILNEVLADKYPEMNFGEAHADEHGFYLDTEKP